MGGLTEALYEIAPAIREILEREEWDEEALDELTEKFEVKAAGVTYFMDELTAFSDMAKAEAKRITDRAKAAQNRADRLKEYLKNSMETAEIFELELGTKKLKIQNNPPKLIVDDAEAIPATFKTVETIIKIDKAAVKAALKKTPIDGVHLETGTNLRIR